MLRLQESEVGPARSSQNFRPSRGEQTPPIFFFLMRITKNLNAGLPSFLIKRLISSQKPPPHGKTVNPLARQEDGCQKAAGGGWGGAPWRHGMPRGSGLSGSPQTQS